MDDPTARRRDPLEVRDYGEVSPLEPTALGAAWRYRWLVLLVVLLFATAGFLLGTASPPSYMATAALVVEDPGIRSLTDAGGSRVGPERYVANQVAILELPAVAIRAAEIAREQLPTVEWSAGEFLFGVAVTASRASDVIEISFHAAGPQKAQVGANAMAIAYQDIRREEAQANAESALQRVQLSLDRLDAELPELSRQIAQLREATEARQELEQQFEQAIARLVDLQARRAQLSPNQAEQLEQIRAELAEIQDQLRTMQLVTQLEEQQNPELRGLLEEQRQAIQRRADLRTRRDQIEVDAELLGSGVALFSPAQLPGPTRAGFLRSLAVGIVFGLLAGAALAYFLALRRRTFVDRSEPQLVLDVPLLAEIPDFTEEGVKSPLPVRVAPTSASAESFRFAAASLEIRMSRAGARSLAIVSGLRGEGKSVVLANTALAAAREGSRVLVVDADFGSQAVTELLLGKAAMPTTGLTELIDRRVPLEEVLRTVPVSEGVDLQVLSRGTAAAVAPEFFRADATRRLFAEIAEQFDEVLVDTPPLLQVAYASTLVGYVDAVAVLVEHESLVSQLEDVVDRLSFIGTPVAGYIYNRSPLRPRMFAAEGSLADILGVGRGGQGSD